MATIAMVLEVILMGIAKDQWDINKMMNAMAKIKPSRKINSLCTSPTRKITMLASKALIRRFK